MAVMDEQARESVQNLPRNHKTKRSPMTKSMQRIIRLILRLHASIHHNRRPRNRLLRLGVPHLANRNTRRNGHHRGGNERRGGDAEEDVRSEDRAGDGGETGGHGEVDLGGRH